MVNFVILCGGSGSRLWPKSREKLPKQLLALTNDSTMLQNTVQRLCFLNLKMNTMNKLVIICNKEHPENHAVKYIKKKPPTYNSVIEDPEGNTVTVIKGLKDTCELLSDPILNKLKKKMIEFCKKYHKDD